MKETPIRQMSRTWLTWIFKYINGFNHSKVGSKEVFKKNLDTRKIKRERPWDYCV